MYFEFYKIAGNWAAMIQLNKNGKYYHMSTNTYKTKSEIIENTFKLFATI
jgi:hypothetical protein